METPETAAAAQILSIARALDNVSKGSAFIVENIEKLSTDFRDAVIGSLLAEIEQFRVLEGHIRHNTLDNDVITNVLTQLVEIRKQGQDKLAPLAKRLSALTSPAGNPEPETQSAN